VLLRFPFTGGPREHQPRHSKRAAAVSQPATPHHTTPRQSSHRYPTQQPANPPTAPANMHHHATPTVPVTSLLFLSLSLSLSPCRSPSPLSSPSSPSPCLSVSLRFLLSLSRRLSACPSHLSAMHIVPRETVRGLRFGTLRCRFLYPHVQLCEWHCRVLCDRRREGPGRPTILLQYHVITPAW
jgi:hypothetical protein